MWTDTTSKQFARSGLRLPSDLTDAEWAVLEPLFPARSHRGRPPLWSYRQIVEAQLYLLRGGLPWRMLPPDLFPPMTTVQHYFYRWRDMGLWHSINHTPLSVVVTLWLTIHRHWGDASRPAASRAAMSSVWLIERHNPMSRQR